MSAGLLTLALIATAPPLADGLQKGDEFTFAGAVAEAVDRPGVRFQRSHELTLRVLVLDRTEKWADAAILTRLKRSEDGVAGAAGAVTGAGPAKDAPPAVRVDLVRVHADGTVHHLAPSGPPPLKYDSDTPARALPVIPLDAFAPFEFGMFPPRPPRSAVGGEPWTVAAGAGRPAETWQAQGFKPVVAEQCLYLAMNQQTADWDRPVGGQTAWRRDDAVWVSTLDGTARKVRRVIRHRDGRAESPAVWVEVNYQLNEQARLDGKRFERARRNVEVAFAGFADATPTLGPKALDARIAKLDTHLEEADAANPYREALVAARVALDAARRGETVRVVAPAAIAPRPRWPEAGQPAPEFQAGPFRLADHAGRPVVLVFFKPGNETTDLALTVADAIEKRYAGKVAVVALATSADEAGEKDRDRLKLAVPVRDGAAAATGYGVETVPRFAVIDAAGKVRWTFIGVGSETGFLLREQVDRLARATSPNGAPGTNPAPGPSGLPAIPRP